MAADERALIEALRGGDAAAFDQLYGLYRARLYAFVVRLTGGQQALAEDICQEAWLKLANHARRLAPGSRVSSWLFTVARNAFISHVRRARLLEAFVPEMAPAATSLSPFETARGAELANRTEQAIAALPIKYREVILLCAGENLGPSEAAAVLGIKPDAVRQRLSRARARLREVLEDDSATRARSAT